MKAPFRHDVVVIGASAGGLSALKTLVKLLPYPIGLQGSHLE
jgi:chemotaxis response regulator CheB